MVATTEVLMSMLDGGTLTTTTRSWQLGWETRGGGGGGGINSDKVGHVGCGQARSVGVIWLGRLGLC
jgi:hypothetical protein